MKFFKPKHRAQNLADIEVDLDTPLIDPTLPEINDVPKDRFETPHRLYREYEPNFEKAEKQGLKAYLNLCKKFGYIPKHVF